MSLVKTFYKDPSVKSQSYFLEIFYESTVITLKNVLISNKIYLGACILISISKLIYKPILLKT